MKFSIKEKTVCATTAVLLASISGLLSLTTAETILDVSSISNIISEPYTIFTASDGEVALEGNNQDYRFCSVLTASYGEKVLFGGNIDSPPQEHSGTAPRIFFFPAKAERNGYETGYGFVAFGWQWKENGKYHEGYAGGMNEKYMRFFLLKL